MACPYFMPTSKLEAGIWMHPARLPLGAGWAGSCSAPGYEQARPADDELREFCNLGYAKCSRLPLERSADAVRFSVARDCGDLLTLIFVFESGHRPAGNGTLEFDGKTQRWLTTHEDARVQRMAECFIQSYLVRRSSAPPQLGDPQAHD